MNDPYKILGVARDASAADIKAAYRKLAKKLHPDLNPGNAGVERKFKEVSQAHAILGDADKRKRFDRGEIDASGQEKAHAAGFYREYAERGQGAKYRPFDFGAEINVEDIISDLFGGGGARGARQRRQAPRRGADVSYTAPIDFLDAAVGAKKRIRLSDGKVLELTIPAGTADRQTLRLKGQGAAGGKGAPRGDAYVEVHIQPHAFFTRKDNDITVEFPVTLQEAILGATIHVPTVHGKVAMGVPPGSNTGTTLRLKGKGIVDHKSKQMGDQYVKLKVMLPDAIDGELKRVIEDWAKAHPYDPRRKAGMT
ncbi:MAG: DnaJ C-terminal domain-containing protein [Kiloniellaceae bacterium]